MSAEAADDRVRVGLDARLHHGHAGGVQQFVIGLAGGLSRLDAVEDYLLLTDAGTDGWLTAHLGWGAHAQVSSAPTASSPRWHRRLRRAAGEALLPARAAWRRIREVLSGPDVAKSDGTIERAGIAVMHFTFQGAF